MLKSNELRIGNWTNRYGDNHKTTVETIFLVDKNELKLLPIPLTPEILVKAGWEKNGQVYEQGAIEYDYYDGKIAIGVNETKFFFWINCEDDHYSYPWTEIKNVHSLQNLVYALTGEELNITL